MSDAKILSVFLSESRNGEGHSFPSPFLQSGEFPAFSNFHLLDYSPVQCRRRGFYASFLTFVLSSNMQCLHDASEQAESPVQIL